MNINIFEIIGLEGDPLYKQLQLVEETHPLQIESFTITKDKFYEISNDEMHLGFKDLVSCYQFLSNAVVTGVMTGEQN